MLKAIQKKVENLRIKVYSGLSAEDTDTALYEIGQMLFKTMDKQLTLTDVVSTYHCESYDFKRQGRICAKQCDSCDWMEKKQ